MENFFRCLEKLGFNVSGINIVPEFIMLCRKKGLNVIWYDLNRDISPRRVDIIKIDVEGNEIAFLKGARKLLTESGGRNNIKLFVEFAPRYLREAGYSPVELLELLDSYCFKAYVVDNDEGNIYPLRGKLNGAESLEARLNERHVDRVNLFCTRKRSPRDRPL